jgi:hypothetical protein
MSLPGLGLRQWKANLDSEERKQKLPYFNGEAEIGTNCSLTRVPIGTVAAYYKDYIIKQGLDKYIRWFVSCKIHLTDKFPRGDHVVARADSVFFNLYHYYD